MRLLKRSNTSGKTLVKYQVHEVAPRYAILSHRWGADTDEVSFKGLMNRTGERVQAWIQKAQLLCRTSQPR
jgi:hypothetical protein